MSPRIRRLFRVAFTATLLALAATTSAGAQGTIYKWTDPQGVVHYTDCPPPPGCVAEEVQQPAQPSAEDVRRAQERLDTLLEEQEARAAEREADRLRREAQEIVALKQAVDRKRACILAQQNLHALLMNRPVYYINERGEREFLDESTQRAEIARQRELVARYCTND
jgi:hypothetical protein